MGYEWLSTAIEALRDMEPYEVIQALRSPRRLPVPAQAAGVSVLSIWSRTATGRPLIVVVRQVGDFDWVIVGARDMDDKQTAWFEHWEAGR